MVACRDTCCSLLDTTQQLLVCLNTHHAVLAQQPQYLPRMPLYRHGCHFAQRADAHLQSNGCRARVAAVQAIASVLQQLFAGGFSFVTTCKACGQSGEASRRVNDFTELSLQVGCSRGGVTGPFIGGSR
jgi:hypothetical protein